MCLQLETSTPAVETRVARRATAPVKVTVVATTRAARRPKRPAPAPDYRTNADVARLVRRFEDGTLPRAEWTHAAHLIVALDYARRFAGDAALDRLRASIKRYNRASGGPRTGYHETITRAWLHLVRDFLGEVGRGRSAAALVDALVERFDSKDLLFEHYSRERLLSAEARAGWVEPDRKPLPGIVPAAEPVATVAVVTIDPVAWAVALGPLCQVAV